MIFECIFVTKICTMNKQEKLEAIEKIIRELEDLKNSETSVLKKVAQIEVDNIELGNKTIENTIPDVYENVDKSLEEIDSILTKLSEFREKFAKENKLAEYAPVEE